ncbi:MAG: hypothetical protein AAGG79_04670 [Pseudomonadota bacterium]
MNNRLADIFAILLGVLLLITAAWAIGSTSPAELLQLGPIALPAGDPRLLMALVVVLGLLTVLFVRRSTEGLAGVGMIGLSLIAAAAILPPFQAPASGPGAPATSLAPPPDGPAIAPLSERITATLGEAGTVLLDRNNSYSSPSRGETLVNNGLAARIFALEGEADLQFEVSVDGGDALLELFEYPEDAQSLSGLNRLRRDDDSGEGLGAKIIARDLKPGRYLLFIRDIARDGARGNRRFSLTIGQAPDVRERMVSEVRFTGVSGAESCAPGTQSCRVLKGSVLAPGTPSLTDTYTLDFPDGQTACLTVDVLVEGGGDTVAALMKRTGTGEEELELVAESMSDDDSGVGLGSRFRVKVGPDTIVPDPVLLLVSAFSEANYDLYLSLDPAGPDGRCARLPTGQAFTRKALATSP